MNKRFFELAKRASIHSDHHSHKIGAVIVRKNKIVSFGFNKLKTHNKSNTPYKAVHAEFSSILSAGRMDLSGCEIYVYRERKDGSLGSSKPCIFCEQLIKNVNLKKVHYTIDNGYKTDIM